MKRSELKSLIKEVMDESSIYPYQSYPKEYQDLERHIDNLLSRSGTMSNNSIEGIKLNIISYLRRNNWKRI